MILIDALHINNSGGKILLDYLIESIESAGLKVFYLLDSRIEDEHPLIRNNIVQYMEASFMNRYGFYKQEGKRFGLVFCFGNLPPAIRLDAEVYTYFHQKLFLKVPSNLEFFSKLSLWLKSGIVGRMKNNTDYWVVQTDLMKREFSAKFKAKDDEVLVIPFYPSMRLKSSSIMTRRKNSFLFVSSYNVHKNHENLLIGFKKFYDINKLGELHLTLFEDSSEIISKVKKMQADGYPIINHGFITRQKLLPIYNSVEYIVYPSFSESFGLGIIEGIENGCKVLGADLDYMKAVCIPDVVFDPYSIDEIKKGFENAVKLKEVKTVQLTFNEIDKILQLLKIK